MSLGIIKRIFRYTLEPTAIEFRSTRKALIKAAPLARKGRFLDIGCGDKPYKEIFDGIAEEYLGMDFPGAAKDPKNIDVHASGLDIPFKAGSFDTALLIQVLEHTPDPARLLSEAGRILVDDGVLIATVPFVYTIHSEPYDYFRYTEYGIRVLFEKHFDITLLECKTYFYKTVSQMTINHFWQNVKKRKNVVLYLLLGIPTLFFISLIQLTGVFLELFSRDDKFTTGYLVVARKKSNPA
jgi:SAM-dependent methyltransferase